MATTKRVSSPYSIHTFNSDPITLDTRNENNVESSIYVYGNLIVSGNSSQVNSTNLTVTDNVITLNDGETQNGVTAGFSGIEIDRGQQPTVTLRWFEPFQKWQITTDGTTYANIATTVAGTFLTAVVEDLDPHLGANLNVNGFSIVSDVPGQHISFNAPLQFNTQTNAPVTIVGQTLVYAAPSTGGGTGLYTSNVEFPDRELISKKKALAYSIIF
jgi:hypothetical protein